MTREESLHRPLAATTLTHRPIIQKDSKNYMSSFSHRDQWPPFLSPEPCECISQVRWNYCRALKPHFHVYHR